VRGPFRGARWSCDDWYLILNHYPLFQDLSLGVRNKFLPCSSTEIVVPPSSLMTMKVVLTYVCRVTIKVVQDMPYIRFDSHVNRGYR